MTTSLEQRSQVNAGLGSSGQAALQFQDEGSNLGTAGTVTTLNFTGGGVTASRAGNAVTVNVPSGAQAFPVGSVFIAVVATDPATLLGYGTWSAFGAGRVLVGLDSGDTDFDTVEETGGSKTSGHTHGVGTIDAGTHPAHTHTSGTIAVATHGSHTHAAVGTIGVNTHSAHSHSYGTIAVSNHASHTHPGSTLNVTGTHGTTKTLYESTTDAATPATHGISGNTGNESATLTHSVSGNTGDYSSLSHTVTGSTANESASLTHSVSGDTGSNGGIASHVMSGSSASASPSVVQPYIVVYMWKRTA